jgi:hypothetical protein
MHLLNVDTLKLETFYNAQVPKYAILSHTWGVEEVTFADIQNPTSPRTIRLAGFEKICKTCKQAKIDQYQYAWIDTCCIDKSSSAELTEAINSMFQWYRDSDACYAYLSDVSEAEFEETFPRSRWFSRGWTLQELLAPDHVVFFDRDWHDLGTKEEHADSISDITGIDIDALCGDVGHEDGSEATIGRFCIAKRMSWASSRETTRVEDVAYCLLGIFNVNMPLLYGEGEHAFIRLQEEIIKRYDDDSILAWGLDTETWEPLGLVPSRVTESISGGATLSNILACSPKDFKNCQNLEYAAESKTPFMMTNLGLHIELPLVAVYPPESHHKYCKPDEVQGWVGLLSCSAGTASKFLGIVLWPAGLDREHPTEVQRAEYGYPSYKNTVLVGPRAAAQAMRSKVTIVQHNESRMVRSYYFGFRHYIINESQALLDIGYSVNQVSCVDAGGGWAFDRRGSWDSTAKVFTIGGKDIFHEDVLRFDFKSQRGWPDSKFSVSMLVRNAITRKTSSFSSVEENESDDLQTEVLTPNDGDTIPTGYGSKHYIIVTVKEKEVLFSQIFEVGVDVMQPDVVF